MQSRTLYHTRHIKRVYLHRRSRRVYLHRRANQASKDGRATSATHAVSHIHVLIQCMQSDQPITCTCISRTISAHRIKRSVRRIKRSVASTTFRLNSHHRGVKPESISRSSRPQISRTRTSLIEISLALCSTASLPHRSLAVHSFVSLRVWTQIIPQIIPQIALYPNAGFSHQKSCRV